MTIKGFKVPNQNRTNLRKPLSGVYEGFKWSIECARDGLFQWQAGIVCGWSLPSSTVEDTLKEVKQTIDLLNELESTAKRFNGSSTLSITECVSNITRVMRWSRLATKGNLKIDTKRRKNGSVYYVVEETSIS